MEEAEKPKEEEFLPCPFCGECPVFRTEKGESLWSHNIVDWFYVNCHNCDIGMNTCDTKQELFDKWNSRAI
jgi:hypothetical protein